MLRCMAKRVSFKCNRLKSGGHSGGEIHKEKGNANKLSARCIYEIMQHHGLQLQKIEGGVEA